MDVSFSSCGQYFADGIYSGICGAGTAVYSVIQRGTGTEDEICILSVLPTAFTCFAGDKAVDLLICCKTFSFDHEKC